MLPVTEIRRSLTPGTVYFIEDDADYKGYISTEYEAGGDPVEGTLKLLEDVVSAMS
jgi:hypothetical protein